jgi:putative ABC transport system permease protein
MHKVTFASLRAHKRRMVGMFLSVFLGVAFLAGTLVMGDTLDRNFDTLFSDAYAGTDVVVQRDSAIDTDFDAERGVIDASIADDIAAVDGVASVAPYVEGFGQILGADGDALGGSGPPQLAGSWIEDPQLNAYRIAEGRAPEAPDEVVINRGAAEDGDLQIGDTTTVSTPEPHEVTIVGLATFGDEDGLGPVTMAFFTLDAAKDFITHDATQVTQIRVRGADGITQDELDARVATVVPDGIETSTGDATAQQELDDLNADFLDALKTFLVVFAGIAMLVAAFSIHNTFSILMAQRTRESALLRTIGASRRQILTWVTIEAMVLGVVASVAGVLGGIGLAQLLKVMFDAFGFALPDGGIAVSTSSVVIAFVVGLVVTMVAGAAPAWKASRVAPLAVLRDVAVDRTAASVGRAVIGGVLLAGGVALVLTTVLSDGSFGLGALGALATIVGVSVFGPVVARPASKVIGAPLPRLRGITGSLARRNAMRNPRRTAGTATALMVGVGVVTLFTVFASSIKVSIEDAFAGSVEGDVIVGGDTFGGGGLSPQLSAELATLPQVDTVLGFGSGSVLVDGDSEIVGVVDPADVPGTLDLDVISGSLDDLGDTGVAISDSVADDNDWDIGTTVPVGWADGTTDDFTVAAVYDDAGLVGDYVLPRAAWDANTTQSFDRMAIVAFADGVSFADGSAAIETVSRDFGNPDVRSRAEFVTDSAAAIDQALGLIYVLLGLAIVIALMGIANTLALAVYERTSELGILRAVGTTRAQVRSMVRWEAVIVAVFGTLTGIAIGVFLGWGLFRLANVIDGFDRFAVPTAQLLAIVVVGGIAGVLAGIRPARRAAKLDVLQAVATT